MEKTYEFELALKRDQNDDLTFSKEGWDEYESNIIDAIRHSVKKSINDGLTPKAVTAKFVIIVRGSK